MFHLIYFTYKAFLKQSWEPPARMFISDSSYDYHCESDIHDPFGVEDISALPDERTKTLF